MKASASDYACRLEHLAQRHSRPAHVADGATLPGVARRLGHFLQVRPAIARALETAGDRVHGEAGLEIRQTELKLLLHISGDSKPIRAFVQVLHLAMGANVQVALICDEGLRQLRQSRFGVQRLVGMEDARELMVRVRGHAVLTHGDQSWSRPECPVRAGSLRRFERAAEP